MLDHCVEDCLAGHAFLEQTSSAAGDLVSWSAVRGVNPAAAKSHPAFKYSIIVGV